MTGEADRRPDMLCRLLAQRRHRLGGVLVGSEDGAAARLDGRALEDVIEEEARDLDVVARAHVRLTGRSTAPAARVRLVLEPHADPARTLGRRREALAHARDSAGWTASRSPPPRTTRRLIPGAGLPTGDPVSPFRGRETWPAAQVFTSAPEPATPRFPSRGGIPPWPSSWPCSSPESL